MLEQAPGLGFVERVANPAVFRDVDAGRGLEVGVYRLVSRWSPVEPSELTGSARLPNGSEATFRKSATILTRVRLRASIGPQVHGSCKIECPLTRHLTQASACSHA